jgi:hypothetical protein
MSLVAIIPPPAENLVWFGEIERKLAKLSLATFTYLSSSYLFMAPALPPPLSAYAPGDLDVGMSFGFNGSSVSLLGAAAAHLYI